MADDTARRIDEAQRQLAALRAAAGAAPISTDQADRADKADQPNQPNQADQATEATGRAADGAVEAVAERGRLRTVAFAPQLLRRTDAELGELLAEAVNEALRLSRARLLAVAGAAGPSLPALETGVEQVRDQGERAMYEIQAALNRAISKVGDRTGLSGDTGGQGLEQLLGALTGTLRAAQHKTVGA